jgi:hypothetical protein
LEDDAERPRVVEDFPRDVVDFLLEAADLPRVDLPLEDVPLEDFAVDFLPLAELVDLRPLEEDRLEEDFREEDALREEDRDLVALPPFLPPLRLDSVLSF